jgi:hypothetical protein
MPNMKKVKDASGAIAAKLKAIDEDEKERNLLRRQRMAASQAGLQSAVADLDKGMKE